MYKKKIIINFNKRRFCRVWLRSESGATGIETHTKYTAKKKREEEGRGEKAKPARGVIKL